MTASGTAVFNLDISDLIEESFERCGQELRTGYELKTARRSLNLLTIEWANRGINLWTVEEGAIPLVEGQSTYDLPTDTIDLLDMVIRNGAAQNQTDININRISVSTYATIPNKNAKGRPIQVWVDRQITPQINVWPVPDGNQFTFVFWRLRRIQDASGSTQTMDIPFRFLNCLVAGLAYYLSMKIPGGEMRLPTLQAEYERQWMLASDEDREKATLRIVPRQLYL